jgi:hypothetical protein
MRPWRRSADSLLLARLLVPREQQTPEALAKHHKAEAEKW